MAHRSSFYRTPAEKPFLFICGVKGATDSTIKDFVESHGKVVSIDYSRQIWEFEKFKVKFLSAPDHFVTNSGAQYFSVYFGAFWEKRSDADLIASALMHLKLSGNYVEIPEFFKRVYKGAPKRNKYNAVKTDRPGGLRFDSGAEAKLYDLLWLMYRGGEIEEIKLQPQVRLTDANIGYKPDFSAFDVSRDCTIWHEMKSKATETEAWRIRCRLWAAGYGPGPLQVWHNGKNGPYMVKEILAKGGK